MIITEDVTVQLNIGNPKTMGKLEITMAKNSEFILAAKEQAKVTLIFHDDIIDPTVTQKIGDLDISGLTQKIL
jgi:hypothetical protein